MLFFFFLIAAAKCPDLIPQQRLPYLFLNDRVIASENQRKKSKGGTMNIVENQSRNSYTPGKNADMPKPDAGEENHFSVKQMKENQEQFLEEAEIKFTSYLHHLVFFLSYLPPDNC